MFAQYNPRMVRIHTLLITYPHIVHVHVRGFYYIYLLPMFSGFSALDATVLAVTEIMWTFVHINHNLVDPVLKYTIQFLLTPVG